MDRGSPAGGAVPITGTPFGIRGVGGGVLQRQKQAAGAGRLSPGGLAAGSPGGHGSRSAGRVRAVSEEEAIRKVQEELERPYGFLGGWTTVGNGQRDQCRR